MTMDELLSFCERVVRYHKRNEPNYPVLSMVSTIRETIEP